jgi:hypothetical protein
MKFNRYSFSSLKESNFFTTTKQNLCVHQQITAADAALSNTKPVGSRVGGSVSIFETVSD